MTRVNRLYYIFECDLLKNLGYPKRLRRLG